MPIDPLPARRSVRAAWITGRIIGQKRPRRPRHVWPIRGRGRLLAPDAAQTFPGLIGLIPVIMLFGVGDVATVIVFAAVPILRYDRIKTPFNLVMRRCETPLLHPANQAKLHARCCAKPTFIAKG